MTRIEREELLRRYLSGEMNLEQEHEFFIQVALDKELRHELKAQQTIDRAFQKDRVVNSSAYAPIQDKVAGILAMEAGMGDRSVSAGGSGTSLFRPGRWLALGAVVIGFAVAWFGLQSDTPSVSPGSSAQETQAVPESPGSLIPVTRPSDIRHEPEAESQAVESSDRPRMEQPSPSKHTTERLGAASGSDLQETPLVQSGKSDTLTHSRARFPAETPAESRPDRDIKHEDSIDVGAKLLWELKKP